MSKLMLLCLGFRKTASVESKFINQRIYSKIGVFSGIHYFVIFALKRRLWVLFMWRFLCVPPSMF